MRTMKKYDDVFNQFILELLRVQDKKKTKEKK